MINFGGLEWIGYLIGVVGLLPWFMGFINRSSANIFDSHVHFIHAPLGNGKTSVVMQYVNDTFADPKMADWKILTTFYAEGTIPFDLRLGVWPSVENAIIVIDEYLLLESNDMIPLEILSLGATLARQLGQKIIIISQHSRLATRHQKFQGTIGAFFIIRSMKLPFKLGRMAMMKKSGEPFRRASKGYKASGQRTFLKWIKADTFSSYQSRKIYGYTCDLNGDWTQEANKRLVSWDEYRSLLVQAAADDLAGRPVSPVGAVGPERSVSPGSAGAAGRQALPRSGGGQRGSYRPGGGRGPGPRGGR